MTRLDPIDALKKLLLDLQSDDATDDRTAYQIALNQFGHGSLCAGLAQALHLAGLAWPAAMETRLAGYHAAIGAAP